MPGSRTRTSDEVIGSGTLVTGAVVVGAAIAADGSAARFLNGVGAALWLVAALVLLRSLRGGRNAGRGVTVVLAASLVLALLVRPSDVLWAAAGFGAAGAVVAPVVGERGEVWARLLPAVWLPTHLLLAAGRAAVRAVRDLPAAVRTDPPPTAAIVPLTMVLAAWLGAELVVRARRRGERGAERKLAVNR